MSGLVFKHFCTIAFAQVRGNFLAVAYLELSLLENDSIELVDNEQKS
ncbi:MAG: hypothetical protein WBM83_16700 [Flavobacteriaceae bacterium]